MSAENYWIEKDPSLDWGATRQYWKNKMSYLGKRKAYPDLKLNVAASRIQSAFQKYKLRKALSNLAGTVRAARPIDIVPGYTRRGGYYGRFTGRNPELKFFDTALSFNFDATAEVPATGQLCIIPQDDTQSGRDGNKCIIKSISMHGIVNLVPAAAANSTEVVYLYVIQDTQCNGAAPAVGDANAGIFTSSTLSQANHTIANSERFRVLKKWVISLTSQAGVTAAYNNAMKPFHWYHKCDIPLLYDASVTTGALTSIRSNNIFLVAGTSGATDDLVALQGTCRLRFADR